MPRPLPLSLSHASAGILWLLCSLPHCSSKRLKSLPHWLLMSANRWQHLKFSPSSLWWPHFYHQQLWSIFIPFNLCLFSERKPHPISRSRQDHSTCMHAETLWSWSWTWLPGQWWIYKHQTQVELEAENENDLWQWVNASRPSCIQFQTFISAQHVRSWKFVLWGVFFTSFWGLGSLVNQASLKFSMQLRIT